MKPDKWSIDKAIDILEVWMDFYWLDQNELFGERDD